MPNNSINLAAQNNLLKQKKKQKILFCQITRLINDPARHVIILYQSIPETITVNIDKGYHNNSSICTQH